MDQLGRMILVLGAVMVVLGGALWLLGRLTGGRGLPGDIVWQSERMTIAFPIVTCIVLSIVLTLALWLWQWISRG